MLRRDSSRASARRAPVAPRSAGPRRPVRRDSAPDPEPAPRASPGGAGNSTSLVGTYEQVAEGLLDYVDLGVTTLLIRGFDPLADARDYGRVIDLVRAGVKARAA